MSAGTLTIAPSLGQGRALPPKSFWCISGKNCTSPGSCIEQCMYVCRDEQ